MQYTTVTNLCWANKEHTLLNCDVTFTELGTVPYTPSPTDSMAHSREIYARCMAGEFGAIADYVLQPDEYPVEVIQNTPPTEGSQTL
jgi:hypothetical protein